MIVVYRPEEQMCLSDAPSRVFLVFNLTSTDSSSPTRETL